MNRVKVFVSGGLVAAACAAAPALASAEDIQGVDRQDADPFGGQRLIGDVTCR